MKSDEFFAPDVPITKDALVAVSVVDQRRYVTNGSKSRNFEGLRRNTFGIVYNAETPTDEPLSTTVENLIVSGAERKSSNVESLAYMRPGTPLSTVTGACVKAKTDRCIVLLLYEWKYDIWKRIRKFEYDMEVKVYDGPGHTLASKTFQATTELVADGDGNFLNMVRTGYQKTLQEIFNDPAIAEALRTPPARPSEPKR